MFLSFGFSIHPGRHVHANPSYSASVRCRRMIAGAQTMSKAIVDPAELRRFAQDLKRFNETLGNQMSVLHGRLVGLGQTWRDQEHNKFAEEFEQTMKVLMRFVEAS